MRYLLFAAQPYAYEILRPLQEAARRRGDEAAWFLEGAAGNQLKAGETQLRSLDEVRRFNPDAVFVPGNVVPAFFPGVKVQVFHGFGIEKKGHFRIRGWFDLYCTHGPLTTTPFEELARQHGHFAVRETGWPKMDLLFDRNVSGKYWRQQFNDPAKPLVLYAPTFSPSLTSAPQLFEQIVALSREGRWNWLVKFHPKMAHEWIEKFRNAQNAQLRVTETSELISLLHAADVLLSDTSSVVAEFLLLDKPVVTFRNSRPGPHLLDFSEPGKLKDKIEQALAQDSADRRQAEAFAAQMHPWRDDRSSERVLDAVEAFIGGDEHLQLKRKPLNVWRRLRMRWKYRKLRR